jgi:hypothetical protein
MKNLAKVNHFYYTIPASIAIVQPEYAEIGVPHISGRTYSDDFE